MRFKSGSFAVERWKAVRAGALGCALLLGHGCAQPTGSRRASPLLTRAWWVGESAALAVGSLLLGASAPTSFLLPALPAHPGEDRAALQFCVQFVFLGRVPSCQASLGFMVWRGRETVTPELPSGAYKQRYREKQRARLLLWGPAGHDKAHVPRGGCLS